MQANEHLWNGSDLPEFAKLYNRDLLAKPDMRSALLMLGTGDVLRSEHLPG